MFEYIKSYYKVDPFIGQKIIHRGNPGIIVEDRGHYLGVNFDADKPGVVKSVHPTDEVIYGEPGVIRKMTRSQKRYQEYLRSDGFDNFKHYLEYHEWQRRDNKN